MADQPYARSEEERPPDPGDSEGDESQEPYEQPQPGSAGHDEEEAGSELQVEPDVEEAGEDAGAGEQSERADQESKHSHPTSDPPANY
jgi:hypothetical protein